MHRLIVVLQVPPFEQSESVVQVHQPLLQIPPFVQSLSDEQARLVLKMQLQLTQSYKDNMHGALAAPAGEPVGGKTIHKYHEF